MRIFTAMTAARAAFFRAMKSPTNKVTHGPHGSSGGTRTNATFMPMRQLREAKPMDRREAIKNSRFLRNRLGLVKALFENTARHAVASGLSPSADSGDKEWDQRADDYFEAIAARRTFDVREEQTFYSIQGVILPDMMCDGDCGGAKVRDEQFQPRVQLFPTEAIGDAAGTSSRDGWREGILRDAVGRPLRYRILKDPLPGQLQASRYYDYPAAEFMHIARFDRININRPMPFRSTLFPNIY